MLAAEVRCIRLQHSHNLWLDMDPGIDDAWALAAATAAADVLGVSTVAGNVPLPHTYGNARRLLQILHQPDTTLLPGADNPLLSPLITAQQFHGEAGTGDWEAPAPIPVVAHTERVWTWWAQHARDLSGIDLVATGPLTNLAVAFLSFPALNAAFKTVTCMCGALPGSQVDKAQEFNIYVDPHAADIVFHWTERLQILGINVAHRALIPLTDLPRLKQLGEVGSVLSQMLGFYSERSRGEGGDPDAFPVDDLTAVAAAVQPELFSWTEVPLAVVREGPLRGTVVISPIDLKRKPVRVATDVDVNGFRDWVWHTMEHFRTVARE